MRETKSFRNIKVAAGQQRDMIPASRPHAKRENGGYHKRPPEEYKFSGGFLAAFSE